MIFIDQINQRLQVFVQTLKRMELAILGIVPNRRTLRQPLFNFIQLQPQHLTIRKLELELLAVEARVVLVDDAVVISNFTYNLLR